uniref:Uncharacterized protein n=1 Tax=Timema bartmani TaxID=61472 RepID=A0A7R9EYJ6_9NEOP|nr:unnamed protein product [Timema bartmani]
MTSSQLAPHGSDFNLSEFLTALPMYDAVSLCRGAHVANTAVLLDKKSSHNGTARVQVGSNSENWRENESVLCNGSGHSGGRRLNARAED